MNELAATNPRPYGISGQHHVLTQLTAHLVEQELTPRQVPLDEISAPAPRPLTAGDERHAPVPQHRRRKTMRRKTFEIPGAEHKAPIPSAAQVGGTVIDGICRDSDWSLQVGYPLFSRGTRMRTGKDRVQLVSTQVPVTIGGVRVRPGDIAVGDRDGVVIVPAERADEVLEVARGFEAAEDHVRHLVTTVSLLDTARAAAGYHALQSRDRAAAAVPAASEGKL